MLLAGGLVIGPSSYVAMGQGNPNPGVIPPHVRAYGLSYAEWGAQWWRWAYSFPAAQFPPLQSGEIDCGLRQSGSVWFLAGTAGQGPVTRSCSIPTGKAVFFPIVGYLNDYPCPDPDFQPPPGETLEQFLTEGAEAIIDLVTQLEVVVDGAPLEQSVQLPGHVATVHIHSGPLTGGLRLVCDRHGARRGHRWLLDPAEAIATRHAHGLLPSGDRLRRR